MVRPEVVKREFTFVSQTTPAKKYNGRPVSVFRMNFVPLGGGGACSLDSDETMNGRTGCLVVTT